MSDHHWIGLRPTPETHFGFIYEVHILPTGRKYIGMKNYWFSSGKSKSRCFDKSSDKWKAWHWKESDWRTYMGSSKDLREALKGVPEGDVEFTILAQCTNSRDLRYAEVYTQVHRDVLTLVDQEGEYIYYNKAINNVRFRPPTTYTEESCRKISEAKKKDTPCPKCGAEEWGTKRECSSRSNAGNPTRRCLVCHRERERKRRAQKKLKSQPRMKQRGK